MSHNTLADSVNVLVETHASTLTSEAKITITDHIVRLFGLPKIQDEVDRLIHDRGWQNHSQILMMVKRFTTALVDADSAVEDKLELLQLLNDRENLIPASAFQTNFSQPLSVLVPALWNTVTFREIFPILIELTPKAKQGKGEFFIALISSDGTLLNTRDMAGDVSVGDGSVRWNIEVKAGAASLATRTGVGTTYHLTARDTFFNDIKTAAPSFKDHPELRTGKCYWKRNTSAGDVEYVVKDDNPANLNISADGKTLPRPTTNKPVFWPERKHPSGFVCVEALLSMPYDTAIEIIDAMLTGYYPTRNRTDIQLDAARIYQTLGQVGAKEVLFDIVFNMYKQSDNWDSMLMINSKTGQLTNVYDSSELSEVRDYFSINPYLYRSGNAENRDDGFVEIKPKLPPQPKNSQTTNNLLEF